MNRSSLARSLSALALLAMSAWTGLAQAQSQIIEKENVLCTNAKEEIVKTAASLNVQTKATQLGAQKELYAKYKQPCGTPEPTLATEFAANVQRQCGAKVTYSGSTFYEDMACCGYDPQRRVFACPVRIKQTFGFGPAAVPGSREYVLHCVASATGWVPVGFDSVHLANALPQAGLPTWQFAVVANANDNLQTVQPMSNSGRIVRSILSWQLEPTGCDYLPIWGNVIEYRVRLDQ